jgi:mono/diheme cytochrome c family protein
VGSDPLRGAADMMPVWRINRQPPAFYWDGANTKLDEVIAAWALASGASPDWMDRDSGQGGDGSSLGRIRKYLDATPPPRYPLAIDAALAATGQGIFASECASCHAPGGPRTGAVVPAEEVGTDRSRLDLWSADAVAAYNRAFAGKPWAFSSFRKTNGFVAPSLEGLWIRAPYLHNGSVPSLAALLSPPEQRPRQFWRGYDLFDATAVGFVASGTEAQRVGSFYDTAIKGNGNGGHTFGTQLEPDRKRALLEYLKGL